MTDDIVKGRVLSWQNCEGRATTWQRKMWGKGRKEDQADTKEKKGREKKKQEAEREKGGKKMKPMQKGM